MREERPDWTVEPCRTYFEDVEARLGATPDALALRPDLPGRGVAQIKTVGHWAFVHSWRDADTREVELPLWIAVQVSIEAHLVGADWAVVAAMTLGDDGGLDLYVLDVTLKPLLMVRIKELVADFWRRVAEKDPYPIDWNRDVATVLQLYADHEGGTIDLTGDEEFLSRVADREALKAIERDGSEAEKQRKIIDAQIIKRLGNASAARLGPLLVSVKTIRVKEKMVRAYSFPQIRVKGDVSSSVAA